jgi:hypothetical protein
MNLLVVESFENLKGPILVMLPVALRDIQGIHPGKYLPINEKIVEVAIGN